MSRIEKYRNPPRLAEWILKKTYFNLEYNSRLGDFEEIFNEIINDKNLLYGWAWYWHHVFKSICVRISSVTIWSLIMLKNYVKIAFRNLIRHKGYSFINIFGMAAGLACCLVILLYIQDEVKFDAVHTKKDNIARAIYHQKSGDIENHYSVVVPPLGPAMKQDFVEVKDFTRLNSFGRISVKSGDRFIHEGSYFFADPNMFEFFDFTFIEGSKENALQNPQSVILTRKGAMKYFGKEDVIGEILEVARYGQMEVTALIENIPENSHLHFQMVMPIKNLFGSPESETRWNRFGFITYVMLEEGADIHQVNSKLEMYNERLRGGNTQSQSTFYLQPMNDIHYGSAHIQFDSNHNRGDLQHMFILSSLGIVLLFIACFNFMNLSIARSTVRIKEVGVRKVIGARKKQLVFQMVAESTLLTAIALFAGVLLSRILLPVFNDLSGKYLEFSQLATVESFIGLMVMIPAIGIISGIYPAFVLTSSQPVNILRGEKEKTGGRAYIREFLIVLQISLTIVMIIMTFTANEQLNFIQNSKLGLDSEQIITLEINSGAVREKWQTMQQELLQIPGIQTASISSKVPFGRQEIDGIRIRPEAEGMEQDIEISYFTIDDKFLETYKIELAAGNNVSKELGKYEESLLINETAARQFGWDNPIGKRIYIYAFEKEFTVTGIVKDFHFQSLHHLIDPLIMPVEDHYMDYISMRINTNNIQGIISGITEVHHKFDSNIPEFAFVDQTFENLYSADRKMSIIFRYSAILSIIISVLGLFGLSSFLIEQRSKELGIRKTLGASGTSIFTLISRDYLKSAVIANIIAWPAAFYTVNKWMQNFAYRTDLEISLFIYSGTISVFIIILTVSYRSAVAALRNPVDSLRYE